MSAPPRVKQRENSLRPVRRVAAAIVMLAVFTACETDGRLGYKPPGLPITIFVSTDLTFEISVGPEFVTPFGTWSVEAVASESLDDDEYLVAIRRPDDREALVFKVRSDTPLSLRVVDSDATFLFQLNRVEVVIERASEIIINDESFPGETDPDPGESVARPDPESPPGRPSLSPCPQGVLEPYEPSEAFWASTVERRIVDTRSNETTLGQSSCVAVEVPPSDVAPSQIVGAALEVSILDAPRGGHTTIYPCDVARPAYDVSQLNVAPGGSSSSAAVIPLGPSRSVCIYTHSGGDLIVDLLGILGASGAGVAVDATRVDLGSVAMAAWSNTSIALNQPVSAAAAVIADFEIVAASGGYLSTCASPGTSIADYGPGASSLQTLLPVSESAACLVSSSDVDLAITTSAWFADGSTTGLLIGAPHRHDLRDRDRVAWTWDARPDVSLMVGHVTTHATSGETVVAVGPCTDPRTAWHGPATGVSTFFVAFPIGPFASCIETWNGGLIWDHVGQAIISAG